MDAFPRNYKRNFIELRIEPCNYFEEKMHKLGRNFGFYQHKFDHVWMSAPRFSLAWQCYRELIRLSS